MSDSNLVIYKYLPYNIAEAVVTGQHLKFSNPKSFNDPFDCDLDRLIFTLTSNNDNHTQSELQQLEEKFGKKNLGRIGKEKLESFYKKSAEEKINKSSICCFSLTYQHPLMWSHYSDSHNGICLAFSLKRDNSPFPLFASDKITQMAVDYPESNISVNYLADRFSGVKQLFFTKSIHWKYEEEFRVQIFTEPGLYAFNKDFLTEVIFGMRVSEELRERFKRLCNRSGYANLNYQKAERQKLELQFHYE